MTIQFQIMSIEESLNAHGYISNGPIGKGGFGSCYLITSTRYNQQFACKVIDSANHSSEENTNSFHREVSALIHLDHPNIIQIYDVFEEQQQKFIILEYCSGGNLKDLIDKYHGIKGDLLIQYSMQIIDALKFCHFNGYSHNDIKPANVFITSHGQLKLADFGLTEHNVLDTCKYVGSFDYMAPEVIQKIPHDPMKSDIWSLGVTLYQLASGELPFGATNGSELLYEIKMGYEKIHGIDQAFSALIKMCLSRNPLKRPSITHVQSCVKKIKENDYSTREYVLPAKRNTSMLLPMKRRLIVIPKLKQSASNNSAPYFYA